ncbi:MAG TPA: cytochrome C oxidase subunit IV family protein [Candidatus Acidoferrum sp.]|nr:cytochrome C oxidase subunit IV family protein [Candidatus Acidoferrum sp.]
MSEHIVSPKVYVGIFLSLMVLTAATVVAAYVNLGPFNIVIALAIASVKATLVVLYFMHARYSPNRTHMVIIAAVFWLAIMLALTLSDYVTRDRDLALNTRITALLGA